MLNIEDVNDLKPKDSYHNKITRCTLKYIQVRTCIYMVGV